MKNFHPTGNCPVRDVLSRLGDKWSMLVLTTLSVNGTMRFSDIHKTIDDISPSRSGLWRPTAWCTAKYTPKCRPAWNTASRNWAQL